MFSFNFHPVFFLLFTFYCFWCGSSVFSHFPILSLDWNGGGNWCSFVLVVWNSDTFLSPHRQHCLIQGIWFIALCFSWMWPIYIYTYIWSKSSILQFYSFYNHFRIFSNKESTGLCQLGGFPKLYKAKIFFPNLKKNYCFLNNSVACKNKLKTIHYIITTFIIFRINILVCKFLINLWSKTLLFFIKKNNQQVFCIIFINFGS